MPGLDNLFVQVIIIYISHSVVDHNFKDLNAHHDVALQPTDTGARVAISLDVLSPVVLTDPLALAALSQLVVHAARMSSIMDMKDVSSGYFVLLKLSYLWGISALVS